MLCTLARFAHAAGTREVPRAAPMLEESALGREVTRSLPARVAAHHGWRPGEPRRYVGGASCGARPRRLPDSKGARSISPSGIHVVWHASTKAGRPSAKRRFGEARKGRTPFVARDVEASLMSKQRSSSACELSKHIVEAGVEADWLSTRHHSIGHEKRVVETNIWTRGLSARHGSTSREKGKHVLPASVKAGGVSMWHGSVARAEARRRRPSTAHRTGAGRVADNIADLPSGRQFSAANEKRNRS
jgi:hypothetical protein